MTGTPGFGPAAPPAKHDTVNAIAAPEGTTDQNTISILQAKQQAPEAPDLSDVVTPDELSSMSSPVDPTHVKSAPTAQAQPMKPTPTSQNPTDPTQNLSKSAQKKLKRKAEWEAGRDDRKLKRRQKDKERKQRRREDPEAYSHWQTEKRCQTANGKGTPVPLTIVYDCGYDQLMTENERTSLGSQLTRAYSDVRKAKWRPEMCVSSFGDLLKERFETILLRSHEKWKGVRFMGADFVEASGQAQGWMKTAGERVETGKEEAEAWKGCEALINAESDATKEKGGDVVYLTSDSPHTLTSLKPYTTYVIGGLVDKNRHKGACYKAALNAGADRGKRGATHSASSKPGDAQAQNGEAQHGKPQTGEALNGAAQESENQTTELNITTAALPIRSYMAMSSRQVLATSHVGEIMLKWLEYGDWGRAFMEVIPQRKGGKLKQGLNGRDKAGEGNGPNAEGEAGEEGEDGEDVEGEGCVVGGEEEESNSEGDNGEMEEDHEGPATKKQRVTGAPSHESGHEQNDGIQTATR